MNLNSCIGYNFALGKLISTKSGKEYEFDIEDDDRFYIYMKPLIIKGKVDGLTEILIDKLFVTDPDKTFFDEKTFTLDTKMLVTDKQNIICAYSVVIKGVRIINSSIWQYEDDEWVIESCKLEIPYKTHITVSEVLDE